MEGIFSEPPSAVPQPWKFPHMRPTLGLFFSPGSAKIGMMECNKQAVEGSNPSLDSRFQHSWLTITNEHLYTHRVLVPSAEWGMSHYHTNLRRLMARLDMTIDEVVERSGLNQRTIKSILSGHTKPQPRTIHRLAAGLGVPPDELFQDPSLLAHRKFDRETNPVVEQVVAHNGELFQGWSEADFDELYSRFGTGGALTEQGSLAAVQAMNQHRDVLRKVAVVLESAEADLLTNMVNVLFERVVLTEDTMEGELAARTPSYPQDDRTEDL